MPALNPMPRRHVIMCQRAFVPKIKAGTKLHTFRPERARQIQPGDTLDLRVWIELPYRSKQEKVCEVQCIGVTRGEIDSNRRTVYLIENGSWYYRRGPRFIDDVELIDFARRDGFTTTHELFEFFRFTHAGRMTGQLIEWNS